MKALLCKKQCSKHVFECTTLTQVTIQKQTNNGSLTSAVQHRDGLTLDKRLITYKSLVPVAVTQFLSPQVNHPNTVFIAPVPYKNKSDLNVDADPLYS